VSEGRLVPRAVPATLLALAFAAAAAAAAVFLGPARVSFADALDALLSRDAPAIARDVVWVDRLPRIALGLGVGAALAVAGVLFQAILRNPLADPYLVGVGPGALLGAAVGGALGLASTSLLGFSALGVAAFLGSALASLVVLRVAGGGRSSAARLLLAGVAVGSFTTAVATWALYAESEDWQNAVRWLLGSLAWADRPRILLAASAAALLTAVAWWRARDLDALALGEDAARLVGVDAGRVSRILAAAGCLLVAAAVATAGLVGFVGLVVPHVARRAVGPGHRGLVPVAALLGAGLLVLADGIARVAARVEVPVGVVTALLGAPVFAAIVAKSGRG